MSIDLSNLDDHEFYMLIEEESRRRGGVVALVTANEIDRAINNELPYIGPSIDELDDEDQESLRSAARDEIRNKLSMYADVVEDTSLGATSYYDWENVLEEAGFGHM